MTPVVVAMTASASALAVMNDVAPAMPYRLPVGGCDETSLPRLEGRLAETPLFTSRRDTATDFSEWDPPCASARQVERRLTTVGADVSTCVL